MDPVLDPVLGRSLVGVDMEDYDEMPLHWAAGEGHEEVVKLLLEQKGVNPDSKDYWGRTPLLEAASKGHEEIVRLLLQRENVNPNSQDKAGISPLWGAVHGGHPEIVRLLLQRKEVDPERPDIYGRSPLFGASSHDWWEGEVRSSVLSRPGPP